MLWQRLPYENGWSFYGAVPVYYVPRLVYLRGSEVGGGGDGGWVVVVVGLRNYMWGRRRWWKGCFLQLWISLTYISEHFTSSSRKALSPPKGDAGRLTGPEEGESEEEGGGEGGKKKRKR